MYKKCKKYQEDKTMMDATKYAPGYYPVPAGYDSWVMPQRRSTASTRATSSVGSNGLVM